MPPSAASPVADFAGRALLDCCAAGVKSVAFVNGFLASPSSHDDPVCPESCSTILLCSRAAPVHMTNEEVASKRLFRQRPNIWTADEDEPQQKRFHVIGQHCSYFQSLGRATGASREWPPTY